MLFLKYFATIAGMGMRSPQITAKIDDQTADVLTRIKAETGISEVEIVRALLNALCRHYMEYRSITLPFILNKETTQAEQK